MIVDKVKGAMRIAAMSRAAKKLGLKPGDALADARAIHPAIDAVEMDAHADGLLLERIADDCDRFTPIVEIDAPDGLMLEITGCTHLFGDETQLRRVIGGRLSRAGLHVRISVAGAPDAARALARFGRIGVVAPGEDEAAVRPLPIAALGAPEETRHALARAGLKAIGDIADMPSLALTARFTSDLTLRIARTLGRACGPVTPRRIVPVCSAERRFPEPIGRAEDIDAVLAELARETADMLSVRRQGGRVFEASFFRADGAVRRIAVEAGRRLRDPAVLMRLFRERIDALADSVDPGFGFDLVRLAVPVAEALDAGQISLDSQQSAESELSDLVGRLAARFGRERVVRFEPVDTHDPDRAARAVSAVGQGQDAAAWPKTAPDDPPMRPPQMFDPPQPVEAVAEVPDGAPARFTWRHVEHRVRLAEGPERIAPEWWLKPGARTRDYYRVEDESGRRFWLFRAGLYGEPGPAPTWFIHGLFA